MSARAWLLPCLVACAWPALSPRSAAAERFHVAPGGDDDAAGDAGHPWRSLQRAAERAGAGDTVEVAAGQYRGFAVHGHGRPGAPLRFVAAGEVVVLGDNPDTPDGIDLGAARDVEVEGFTLRGPSRAGIRAEGCARVALRRNRVEDAGGAGISLGFCDGVLVEGNQVAGARRGAGVEVLGGRAAVLRGNRVEGSARDGIRLDGAVKRGGAGVVEGARVEENTVTGCGGSGVRLDGAPGAVVATNVVWGNLGPGVLATREEGGRPSRGVRLIGNTIVAPVGAWAVQLAARSTGALIANDVLISLDPDRGAIDASVDSLLELASGPNAVTPRFTVDGGATVVDLSGWQIRTHQEQDSVEATAEALFEDLAAGDLRPRRASPARDRGLDRLATARDARGMTRVVGPRVDLGAYEACDGPCVPATATAAVAAPVPGGCGRGKGRGSAAPALLVLAGLRPRGRRSARRPR